MHKLFGERVLVCIAFLLGPQVGMSYAQLPSGDALCRTLELGLEHRASTVDSLEGYVLMTGLYGPGDDEHAADEEVMPGFGHLRFYAMRGGGQSWLIETLWHAGANGADQQRRHDVRVLKRGVFAWRSVTGDEWATATDPDRLTAHDELMWSAYFLRPLGMESWEGYCALAGRRPVSQEDVGPVSCYRLEVLDRHTPHVDMHVVMWIDPHIGFALRRWTMVTRTNGRLLHDSVGYASDFRQVAPGLWLPRRTVVVKCVAREGVGRVMQKVEAYDHLSVKANCVPSEDVLAPLVFTEEFPSDPYEPRLQEEALVEVEVATGGGRANTEVTTLADAVSGALSRLREEGRQTGGFVEPLPELPMTGQ